VIVSIAQSVGCYPIALQEEDVTHVDFIDVQFRRMLKNAYLCNILTKT
jgi:hypothetical protein